ncbi:hypothetical protein [Halobacillus mangrovi]|uniref:Uncharacterized protein n=1 Tax=Halobacillus mangrovi TaxID=402384 RepID=A0A1W5ZW70_9BACI|nr:hypothetical protein [Halobacillus mangrovi]ARI77487.1 hypothetical protein HM131_11815 [Halobacillus mangrovi]
MFETIFSGMEHLRTGHAGNSVAILFREENSKFQVASYRNIKWQGPLEKGELLWSNRAGLIP